MDEEDEDLQRALQLSREEASQSAGTLPPPMPQPELPATEPHVLGQIPTRFRLFAAAAAGHAHLEATGRILLPQSCLQVFASFLGELPDTLLLRLVGGQGSSIIVGVAEFLSDRDAAAMAAAADARVREQPLPRLFDRGPLALAFLPRWIRGALLVDPSQPEAFLQIVSLPKACYVCLRPHRDTFAAALGACAGGDVRGTLTPLLNAYPALSCGATLALMLDGVSHQVDVTLVRAQRHVRCGVARDQSRAHAEPPIDVTGSRDGGGGDGDSSEPRPTARGEAVGAACLVDADVEIDFVPSMESEVCTAQAAAAERQAKEEEEARAAARVAAVQAAEASDRDAAETRRAVAASALRALQEDEATSSATKIACAVRLPNGKRCMTSLTDTAPLEALWWLVDSSGDSGLPPARDFALVSRFPHRRLLRPSTIQPAATIASEVLATEAAAATGAGARGPTLREAGLADAAQQAFFVEAL